VARTEVIGLMNGDGARLLGTGADAVGSLPLLAPFRSDDQTRVREHSLQARVDLLAKDHAVDIRQQQRIAGSEICS